MENGLLSIIKNFLPFFMHYANCWRPNQFIYAGTMKTKFKTFIILVFI